MAITTPGKLIVIEGSDYSGHSTQTELLKEWLEHQGHAVFAAGIKRSKLMRQAIIEAKEEQVLGKTTLGLLYATDFADELENGMIPALRAGMVVVADRYMYTIMARQLIRGAQAEWLEKLFEFALRPDLVFYLSVPIKELMHRCFHEHGQLSYWESGMDMALADDMVDSFLLYQERLCKLYDHLAQKHNFQIIDGSRPIQEVHEQIRSQTDPLFDVHAERIHRDY